MSNPSMELQKRFFQTVMRTQWLDEARLARYCDGLLAGICTHARETTPFYRDTGRFDRLLAGEAISIERWQEVPVLTRREAIEAASALHAEATPEPAGETSKGKTSGSTGSVFHFVTSALSTHGSVCINERFAETNALDGQSLLAQISGFAMERIPPGREMERLDWRALRPGGRCLSININEPPAFQWAWLAAKQAPYLLTYATNARAIAEAVLRGDAPGLRFEAVLTFAETLDENARATIREAFGGRVLDRYGCQEAGMLATECPAGRYHAASEINRIEIVDESGQAVAEGETGRVLVTTLYNYAMPLIRYFIGDYATRAVGPCPCGRNGLTLSRIAGRTRNLFRYPDGTLRWPSLSFKDLVQFFAFERLQVVQVAPDRLEFRYVPVPASGPVDEDGLRAYLRSENMADFSIDFVPVSELKRGHNGKFEEFLCLI